MNPGHHAERYLAPNEVGEVLGDWADRHPEWARWEPIGASLEGRPMALLTIGRRTGPPLATRPAIWLDGGTHASEWAGVMACVHAATSWLERLGCGDPATTAWFHDHVAYVLPNVSPDGMTALWEGAPYLRSVLRTAPDGTPREGLCPQDIDGDGFVRQMRWRHPAGPFVPDEAEPLLVRARTLDDPPDRACFVAPEGLFESWDGARWIAAPRRFPVDLNRNFPARWAPFRMFGMDGGPFPLSEPESRAMVDAVQARPGISAAITFHTYTGALLTQPYAPDSALGDDDIALMYRLGTELTAGTGYRTLKVHPEFQYDSKRPIVGVWADTLATTFGLPGYTLEVWDPYGDAGAPVADPARFFVHPDADVVRAFVRRHASSSAACPWRPFEHPQLGPVEIGGLDPRFTLYNPPVSQLAEELGKTTRMLDRLRQAVPRLVPTVHHQSLGDGWAVLTLVLENQGFLPSSALPFAERSGLVPPIVARAEAGPGGRIDGDPQRVLGHVDGWGQAAGLRSHPFYADLSARGHRTVARWVVRGPVRVRWTSARAGSGVIDVPAP